MPGMLLLAILFNSPLVKHIQQASLALLVMSAVAMGVNIYLLRFYRRGRSNQGGLDRAGKGEFSPLLLGEFSLARLAIVSMFSMFLELLMIRWISTEITMFAYFKNLVLISCFLGFGVGCYLSRRRISLVCLLLPFATITVFIRLPWEPFRAAVGAIPGYLGAFSDVAFWESNPEPVTFLSIVKLSAAICVVTYIFTLVAFVFIPIGQLVGWYLERAPKGITGYSVNVLASLAGILVYTVLCIFYSPPAVWICLAGCMLVAVVWKAPALRYIAGIVFAGCALLAAVGPHGASRIYWSPYQKVTVTPVRENGETISYELATAGSWYQQILNLSPDFVAAHPDRFKDAGIEWNPYNLPYRFYPVPPSVLILGAGTGNDVAAALRNGAGHVVAVEIDPMILKLGRDLHPEQPYASSRVTEVLNDARSYLQSDASQFDLIVFSLLDSHTTSSYYTNIRIDNYVYTVEALAAAKQHLKPDGLMIVKFSVQTPWIAGRLYNLLDVTFGRPPLQLVQPPLLYASSGTFFIAGSQDRMSQALRDSSVAEYVAQNHGVQPPAASLTTDDWPYFYQHERGFTTSVAIISAVLVLLCWFFLREAGMSGRSLVWHFFFLGAGFMLLEAQIVSKMALLFGTTWAVNAIVIAGLLILIVAANVATDLWPRIPISFAYVGVFASVLVAYVTPLQTFFFRSLLLKMASAGLVLCLPVFFAGVIFIRGYAREEFRGEALGSNLLGALVGGLMESLSYMTGIRSLLLFAAGLYLASWIALRYSEVEQADSPREAKKSVGRVGIEAD